MLQCVAVCCSALSPNQPRMLGLICGKRPVLHCVECVALCCSVLQCFAVFCCVLQSFAVCCSVLQCVALRCSVLQCSFLLFAERGLICRKNPSTIGQPKGLEHCSILQHTATHYNSLLHNPTHCSTLQHAATRCNTSCGH